MRHSSRYFFVLLFCAVAALAADRNGLRLISSSPEQLVVEYTPGGWRVDTVAVADEIYQRYHFAGSESFGEAGAPQQLAKTFVVGLPLQGVAALQILEAPHTQHAGQRLLPVGTIVEPEGSRQISHAADEELYKKCEFSPPAFLSEPEMFRGQKVSRLVFLPLQFDAVRSQIHQYQRIVVSIRFGGATNDAAAPSLLRTEEEVFRQLLLNYDQARSWRQKPQSRLTRSAAPVFAGENWYKIVIKGNGSGGMDGIYRLTPATLSRAGVPTSTLDPRTIRIYHNGGRELPENLSAARPAALIENAIHIAGEEDGRFDDADYILFYGRSLEGFAHNGADGKLRHHINRYGYENIYWLTFGESPGKRMTQRNVTPGGGIPESSFRDLAWSEEEKSNVFKSGSDWLGFELAREKNVYTAVFALPGARVDGTAQFRFQMAATTTGTHQFRMKANGNAIGTMTMSGSSGNGYVVRTGEFNATGTLLDGNNQLSVEYTITSDVQQAYVDWIEVEYQRHFEAVNDNLLFYGPLRSGSIDYEISRFSRDDILLFDVTEYQDVAQLQGGTVGSRSIRFTDAGSEAGPRRYLAVTPGSYRSITEIRKDAPADLRQTRDVDYIIITHDSFYQQALQLESLREDWDPSDRLATEGGKDHGAPVDRQCDHHQQPRVSPHGRSR